MKICFQVFKFYVAQQAMHVYVSSNHLPEKMATGGGEEQGGPVGGEAVVMAGQSMIMQSVGELVEK